MTATGMDISGTELERAFNRKWDGTPVSVQAAWNWINGRTVPRSDKLQVLAKTVRVDPHALLYGSDGPLTAAERKQDWEERVTYAERETIETFLRLPVPQRLLVRDVITAVAKAYGTVEPGKE